MIMLQKKIILIYMTLALASVHAKNVSTEQLIEKQLLSTKK